MENILFITDSFTGGGLETRIIEQIKILKKYKIQAFLICHDFNPIYSKNFVAVSNKLLLGSDPDNLFSDHVIKDMDLICRFCDKHNIDFIDSHPFWCILPTVLAANKMQIPASFTLHGVASGNIIKNKYPTAKALYHLSLSYGFNQIFAVAEYLTDLYSYLLAPKIIRNGFIFNERPNKTFKNTHKVAIISRLDEPKSKIVLDFLPEIYSCDSINQIDIFGDGNHINDIRNFISQNHLTDKINLLGWTENLSEKISNNNYMVVFGMGRVILDAIKANVPAGILGYGGFAGLVNHRNLMSFSENNLTSWEKSINTVSEEIENLSKNPHNYYFKDSEISLFNATPIWQEYYSTIKTLKYHNNPQIQKLLNLILENPTANLIENEHIFLECIRLLSDGNKPIDPQFFYIIFQKQFDEIHKLHQTNIKPADANKPAKTQSKLLNRLLRKK